jgi:hypothetical protein
MCVTLFSGKLVSGLSLAVCRILFNFAARRIYYNWPSKEFNGSTSSKCPLGDDDT